MASQTSLDILIRTVADATGLKLTTEQAEKLQAQLAEVQRSGNDAARSSRDVADAAQSGAKQITEFTRAGGAATMMMGGLARASRGGTEAIFGVAAAFRGFLALVRGAIGASGPVGLLITALGLAAGAFALLSRRTKEAQTSIEDMRKSTAALAKLRLDALNDTIRRAGREADEAREKFAALQAAAERLDNAEQAARLAEVRADPSLSQEQKVLREAQIRREFESRADARRRESLDADVQAAQRRAEAAEKAAAAPAAERERALAEVQRLQQQASELDQLPALEQRRRQLIGAGYRQTADLYGQRIDEIRSSTTGFSIDKLTAAIERLGKLAEVDAQARERVQESQQGLRAAEETRALELGTMSQERALRERATRADLTTAVVGARQQDAAAMRRADGTGEVRQEIEQLTRIRGEERAAVEESIRALEDRRFRLPALSQDAVKIDEEIAQKRAELQTAEEEYATQIASLNAKLVEAPKGSAVAMDEVTKVVSKALDDMATGIVAAGQAAAARIASAGSGGTIQRGGETIRVEPGDQVAVANALDRQAAANDAVVASAAELARSAEKTERQMTNMRTASPGGA